MRKGTAITAAAGVALGLLAAAGHAVFSGAGAMRADPEDAELVALGRAVYAETCAACHGKNLEGEPNWRTRKADGTLPAPPHDAGGHTWHHDDALLFRYTKEGGAAVAPAGFKSGMPAFGDSLSDRQIVAVLAFLKSQWPEAIRQRQEAMNRRSR